MSKKLAGMALLAGLAMLAMSCARGVTRTTSYRASDGSLIYVGEAYNNGSSDLDNATIEATFRDAAGNVIRTETTVPCRVMAKNTASVFELRLPPGTAEPARVDWKLLGDDVPSIGMATGLSAQIHTAAAGTNFSYFYGEMRNDSPNIYYGGYVCIGWKDAAGSIVRMGEGPAAPLRLGPGQIAPFGVVVEPPPGAAEAVFYLDAVVTLPGTAPAQIVDVPMSAYQHASTFGPASIQGLSAVLSLGEVRNNTSSLFVPRIFGVIRDPAGKVLAASTGADLCNVAAPPGGFTIAGYVLNYAASTSVTPTIAIEALKKGASQRVALSTTNVAKSAVRSDGVTIGGKVKNISSKAMNVVHVCAIAYAANGNVIGAMGDTLFPAGGLAPNATLNFSIEVPAVGAASSVKAIADGVPQ